MASELSPTIGISTSGFSSSRSCQHLEGLPKALVSAGYCRMIVKIGLVSESMLVVIIPFARELTCLSLD